MAQGGDNFKTSIQNIRVCAENLREEAIFKANYSRIDNVEEKFQNYLEEVTAKSIFNEMYFCRIRMKFYGDKMLFFYLEISENGQEEAIWPVKITWKVEIIDENNAEDKKKVLVLGELSSLYNKPKEGLASHSNDWISVNLEKIISSGLISDNSVTVKWSALVEPVLIDNFLDRFEELVGSAEDQFDVFHKHLHDVKDDVAWASSSTTAHECGVSRVKSELPDVNDKLDKLLETLEYMDCYLKSFSNNNGIISNLNTA
ncbi:hypothetical protein Bpfe_020521 [Biomphalaria pfeifferi]|uniref:Uncharacterized protein n=1 Tax=Biomphalaria pfeifferi TaxID=112525 RepID=A0AAD8F3H4_BIOPF|nr:hypothetical protein Bpfe_020521 [Biomphalaria pfeifferi]